jgi:hypothetical protein
MYDYFRSKRRFDYEIANFGGLENFTTTFLKHIVDGGRYSSLIVTLVNGYIFTQ